MNWYKISQEDITVHPEYWQSLGNWVLVPTDQPRDRNLRPMGRSLETGINIEIFEFDSKEKAEKFATEKGWKLNELV